MAADTDAALRRRRRASSASPPSSSTENSTLVDTVKSAEHKIERAILQTWDDLPHWRRDNAFITTGYRPTSNSYAHSLRSVFSLHNESVNIWTHLAGAIAFTLAGLTALRLHAAVIAPRYASASRTDVLVFACFFAGALLCLGMSATFHALCNHSPDVARWGNKLDYTGIVFLIVGSYVPALYYGLHCLPRLLELYLSGICILGGGCLVVSWFDHFRTPEWRPYRALMFVGLGVSGVVPVVQGLTIYGFRDLDDRMGLRWVLLEGALYISGAFIYAIRWPERMSIKTFDIWGSSHQIFHVLILLAAASHLYGMVKAFDHNHGFLEARC